MHKVDSTSNNPLVTFVLLTYNHEKYIRGAMESALAQTYQPLEIIVSDDYSSDATYEIICEIAERREKGKRLLINRNKENLGITNHLNLVVSKSSGEIIILAAGDDVSLPSRTQESVTIFNTCPEVYSCSFSLLLIDKNGVNVISKKRLAQTKTTLNQYLKGKNYQVVGASSAYRREVFTAFSALDVGCPAEDDALTFRALLLGGIFHSKKELVQYRILSGSASRNFRPDATEKLLLQRKIDADTALTRGIICSAQYTDLQAKFQEFQCLSEIGIKLRCTPPFYSSALRQAFTSDNINFWQMMRIALIALKIWATKSLEKK